MTTVPINVVRPADPRVTIPAGLDGFIVRLGLAISRWGTNRSTRVPARWGHAEQMRENLPVEMIFYRMR